VVLNGSGHGGASVDGKGDTMPGRNSKEAVGVRSCAGGRRGCGRRCGAARKRRKLRVGCNSVEREEGHKIGRLILFFSRNS
jgi:hypothetical protein